MTLVNKHEVTLEGVVELLIRHRLLSAEDLVADHVAVRRVGGRNDNFVVRLEGGPGHFLKYARRADHDPGRLLAVEAGVYEVARQLPALAGVLPELRLYDSEDRALILEHLRGTYEDSGVSGSPVATALARAIAVSHRVDISSDVWAFVPRRSPWALALGRPQPQMLREMSPAQARVIALVQKQAAVCGRLDELRLGWTHGALVHGDLKWPNVIVDAPVGDSAHPVVKLLDWELASLGDPAWDIGSVFHSYLAQGVLALDLPRDAQPGDAAEAFATKLPAIHREHRAFWSAYVEAADVAVEDRSGLAQRATQFCGARLLQSAYEWSNGDRTISRQALPILQLGQNILAHPGDALRRVVGIASTAGSRG